MRIVINEWKTSRIVKVYIENKLVFKKSLKNNITCVEDILFFNLEVDSEDKDFIEMIIFDKTNTDPIENIIGTIRIRKDAKENFKEWMRL